MLLFHITTEAAWARAKAAGEYRPESLDREGFIHLSTEAQVPKTAARFFAGQSGLVLLVIDAQLIEVNLRFEEGEPGEQFPHLYAALPVNAVREARPFSA